MAYAEQDYIDGWQVYSDWIDDLRDGSDLISSYDEDSTFKEKLLGCKSNLERFEFLWNNEAIVKEVRRAYQSDKSQIKDLQSSRAPKSIGESKKLRELGNKLFKEGDYHQACTHYTQAVRFAPFPTEDDPDTLAIALANRSAALFALNRYRLCLMDLNMAISFGYPEANLYKLHIRKIKCLHILSIWDNCGEELKFKLTQMMNDRNTKDFLKTEISNMFEFVKNTPPDQVEKDDSDLEEEIPDKLCNTNKLFPTASDCVELGYEDDSGRCVLLTKDVGFGRLLIAEEPFVSNLAPSRHTTYCYKCHTKLHNCGLCCSKCTQVFYCSRECFNHDQTRHSYECGTFLDFQHLLGVAYLVPHIMYKIDFNAKTLPFHKKKGVINKPFDEVAEIKACEWPDLYFRPDYTAIVSLLDHAEDYDYDSMMGYVLTAIYLTIAFKDYYPEKFSADEESTTFLGSVILRHLLQLQTNLISVLDQDMANLAFVGSSLEGMKERPIGVALYPTICMMNHS